MSYTLPVNVIIGPTTTYADPTVVVVASSTPKISANYTVSPNQDLNLALQQIDNEPFVGVPKQPPV